MLKKLSFLFIILLICGCSSSKKIIISDTLDSIPVITGSVINLSAFEKGGTLALGSFKAGAGAEADNETDELSSMMIKGIKDNLPGENTRFALQSDDQKDSDCLLDGHIENYGHDGQSPDLKLRKNQVYLSVDGEISLRETGEKIFQFQTSTKIDTKTQDPKVVAYEIGTAIAHGMGSKEQQ